MEFPQSKTLLLGIPSNILHHTKPFTHNSCRRASQIEKLGSKINHSLLYTIMFSSLTMFLDLTGNPLPPFTDNMFHYFNINLLTLPSQLYGHYYLAFLDFIIPLIFGTFITVYLREKIKHEFK
ncbi:MAG: hypothetical protein QXO71_08455 [Candidatus Jordarchaeaceae archaeon]